jgi:secondary thiamine-phosphate synthase enzyme
MARHRPLDASDENGSPTWVVSRSLIPFETDHCRRLYDVTDLVAERVSLSGVRDGTVTVQTLHTTTGIVVNEHEPLLLEDLTAALDRWAPRSATYRHDDLRLRVVNLTPDEPANGHAHVQALLLRASETLAVADGALELGRWQRIFLAELDGPRSRRLSVTVMGLRQPSGPGVRLRAVSAATGAAR